MHVLCFMCMFLMSCKWYVFPAKPGKSADFKSGCGKWDRSARQKSVEMSVCNATAVVLRFRPFTLQQTSSANAGSVEIFLNELMCSCSSLLCCMCCTNQNMELCGIH